MKRRARALRLKALDEARRLIGVMERGANNRGPMVDQIIRANGGTPGEPWCGDFNAWCYRKAGARTVTRAWCAVRSYGHLPGQVVTLKPLAGDVVCFNFDHTGLVEHYCNDRGQRRLRMFATHIRTIEGNTGPTSAVSDSSTGGDGVYRKVRHLSQVDRYVRVLR